MAIQIDVNNVPDIIEAQLTLSYSRLTDLFHLLMDRSNEHDDALTALQGQVGRLTEENASLREEIGVLRESSAAQSSASRGALQTQLETLQREVERMEGEWSSKMEALEQQSTSRERSSAALQELEATLTTQVQTLEEKVNSLHLGEAQSRETVDAARRFMEVWGVQQGELNKVASDSKESRSLYIQSLPPIASLLTELQKTNESLEERLRPTTAHTTEDESGKVSQEVQESLQSIDQRLCEVEAHLPNTEPSTAKSSVGDRLAHLEGRLQHLLNASEGKSEGGAALTDLAYRVSLMEETVEGLPKGLAPPPARQRSPIPGDRPTSPADSQGKRTGSLPPLAAQRHPSRHIEQPAVDALRKSGTGERSVSVAVGQEDGLRRRVAQLEENVAQLEINKADHTEIQALEELLKESLHPHGITLRTQTVAPYVVERAETKASTGAGRPVYVGGSSVFMNDGAKRTTAASAAYSSTV